MRPAFILMLAVILALSSCVQRRQLLYVQDIQHEPPQTYELPIYQYQLQPGDILYVDVKTKDRAYSSVFEEDRPLTQRATLGEAQAFISGYTIDQSGEIDLPLLGKIHVGGMAISEAKEAVQKQLDGYFKDAKAEVKIMRYAVTVLGEVGNKGVILNYQDRVTIFDVISRAGDITDFGDRKNVLVMRPTPEGITSYRVDLTRTSVFESEVYYLLPNDIVVVEPLSTKLVRINSPSFSFAVSVLTTMLFLINLLN